MSESIPSLNESTDGVRFWLAPDGKIIEWPYTRNSLTNRAEHHGQYAVDHPELFGQEFPDMMAASSTLIREGWARGYTVADRTEPGRDMNLEVKDLPTLHRALLRAAKKYGRPDKLYYDLEEPPRFDTLGRAGIAKLMQTGERIQLLIQSGKYTEQDAAQMLLHGFAEVRVSPEQIDAVHEYTGPIQTQPIIEAARSELVPVRGFGGAPKEVRLVWNPSGAELYTITRNSPHEDVRGLIVDPERVCFWDAAESDHIPVAKSLGLDISMDGENDEHSMIGNYDERDDRLCLATPSVEHPAIRRILHDPRIYLLGSLNESDTGLPMKFLWHPQHGVVSEAGEAYSMEKFFWHPQKGFVEWELTNVDGPHHSQYVGDHPEIFGAIPDDYRNTRTSFAQGQGWIRGVVVHRGEAIELNLHGRDMDVLRQAARVCVSRFRPTEMYIDQVGADDYNFVGPGIQKFLRGEALTEAAKMEELNGVKCWLNPLHSDLLAIIPQTSGQLRCFFNHDHLIVWDAFNATNAQIAAANPFYHSMEHGMIMEEPSVDGEFYVETLNASPLYYPEFRKYESIRRAKLYVGNREDRNEPPEPHQRADEAMDAPTKTNRSKVRSIIAAIMRAGHRNRVITVAREYDPYNSGINRNPREQDEDQWTYQVEISDFFAKQTGHGSGTKAMTQICEIADRTRTTLFVYPSSGRNVEFYGRFGFVRDPRGRGMLVRHLSTDLDESVDKSHRYWMGKAVELSGRGLHNHLGGPFGAVIVRDGKLIGQGSNRVFVDHNPLEHAEMVAIRDATQRTESDDLSGAVMYTSSQPCPMCMSGILWAKLDRVYYGNTREQVGDTGLDDSRIQDALENPEKSVPLIRIEDPRALTYLNQYDPETRAVSEDDTADMGFNDLMSTTEEPEEQAGVAPTLTETVRRYRVEPGEDWDDDAVDIALLVNPTPGEIKALLAKVKWKQLRAIGDGTTLYVWAAETVNHAEVLNSMKLTAQNVHTCQIWFDRFGATLHHFGANVPGDGQAQAQIDAKWFRESPAVDRALSGYKIIYDDNTDHLSEAEHQWGTPEFRAWFGKSKAVDQWGRPQRFYHGSPEDFDAFSQDHSAARTMGISRGYYFTTNPEFADNYADKATTDGAIIPVYLSVKKVLRMSAFSSDSDWERVLGKRVRKIADLPDRAQTYWYLKDGSAYAGREGSTVGSQIIELLKLRGYDAVVFPEKSGFGPNGSYDEVWCVFDPNKIKSAVGNSGAFNPESPKLVEGQIRRIEIEHRNEPFPVTILFNPNPEQLAVLIEKSNKHAKSPGYEGAIRGLLVDTRNLCLWDGYESIHHYVQEQLDLSRAEPFYYNGETNTITGLSPNLLLYPAVENLLRNGERIREQPEPVWTESAGPIKTKSKMTPAVPVPRPVQQDEAVTRQIIPVRSKLFSEGTELVYEDPNQIVKCWHVCPAGSVPRILKRGLIPQIGARSAKIGETEPAIYVFVDWTTLNDALCNWLGVAFRSGQKLSILEVSVPAGWIKRSPMDSERIIYQTVPPGQIKLLVRDVDETPTDTYPG